MSENNVNGAPEGASEGSIAGLIRDGLRGSFRQADPALREMRERIVEARDLGRQLLIEGSGSKRFYGESVTAGGAVSVLPVSGYRGIVSYEPTELVITAKCGTPLIEIEAALEERGQVLAFEPPRFPSATGATGAGPVQDNFGGTLGGAVATGLSGPRRVSAGAAKDFILGAALVDSSGQWLQFGGTVMKNVAGYDVARLLCGSMGMFGVIAEVSVKVLPKPAAEQTLSMPATMEQALAWLNEWGGQPLPVAASLWSQGQIFLRLAGAAAAVDRASGRFVAERGAVLMDAAAASVFWDGLRDQNNALFVPGGVSSPHDPALRLWRVSVPSTAAAFHVQGEQWLEWGGALRWCRTTASASEVRSKAEALGGTAMLYRGEFRSDERAERRSTRGAMPNGVGEVSRFHPLSPALLKLHQKLKAELDPRGVFNPSRMYPGL